MMTKLASALNVLDTTPVTRAMASGVSGSSAPGFGAASTARRPHS